MKEWQLQDAKAQLSKLVTDSQKEPQIISRHGKRECVIVSFKKYKELLGEEENIVSFFKNSPFYDVEIDFSRDTSLLRGVKF